MEEDNHMKAEMVPAPDLKMHIRNLLTNIVRRYKRYMWMVKKSSNYKRSKKISINFRRQAKEVQNQGYFYNMI